MAIKIGGRKVGPEYPPFMIADVGANHDGSLDRARYLIEAASNAGVDAVKFQNFSALKLVSRRGFEELGQIGHQADWAKDVYSTYEDASVPFEWTEQLVADCAAHGIAYLTTPYDLKTVDVLDPFVPAWKLGSGDITYLELIRHVASKGKPVLLATGASDRFDVNRALRVLRADGQLAKGGSETPAVCLMQCNSDYSGDPQAISHSNLRVLSTWAKRYPWLPLGLSDHTPGWLAVIAAVAMGACVIEKHLTDDKTRSGPDHAFAMEPEEWKLMVSDAQAVWEALGDGVKKVEENEREAAIVQRRALRWAYDISPEDCIPSGRARYNFVATRPCPPGALEPYRVDDLVERFLKRDVEADTLVRLEDFE